MDETQSALLRRFRRLYFRARDAQAQIAASGGIGLQVKYEGGALSSQAVGSEDQAAISLVVLMRHFLNPDDDLYYEEVWRLCHEVAGNTIGPDLNQQVTSLIESLRAGDLPVTHNGRKLTAEALYRLYSDGGFFQDDRSVHSRLQELTVAPIGGDLTRFVFFDYSLKGYTLMSALFGILRSARAFDRPPAAHARCIFCLDTEGGFTSEEHVLPEALGNDRVILEPGVVCDACNNGVLSDLDQALTLFEPISFLRVLFVPHTKVGKLPTADFGNVAIQRTEPRRLRFAAKNWSGLPRELEELDDGRVRWTQQVLGARFDPRPVGRALCKAGLELIALEEGPDVARSARFDEVRRFVIADDGFPNSLLLRTVGTPSPAVRVSRDPSFPGTVFSFSIYGLVMAVNLETSPRLEVRQALASHDFVAYPLDSRTVA